MSAPDFQDRVERGAAALGIALSPAVLDRLAAYQALLERWASRVNLVAVADGAVTAERHFVDSLALLRLLPEPSEGLADIGSGAGFPGLVVAAARPEWAVTLVEPTHKRAAFLAVAAAAMGLREVRVDEARLEALGPGIAPLVVSRAVLAPAAWLLRGARLLTEGGRIVTMAATEPSGEEEEARRACGLAERARDRFVLPESGAARVNTLYQRERVGEPC